MCAVGMHPPHLENSYPDLGLEIISNLTLAFFFFFNGSRVADYKREDLGETGSREQ